MPLHSRLDRSQLEAFWMPFTANRQFKANPRLLARAAGMHYWTADGRQILDGCAGLWCVNAGHGRQEITDAVSRQIATMDYAPPFQMGHPAAFELANEIVGWLPAGIDHVFFTNSGSESVDTALKIALAWHRVRGQGTRTRLIGRERGYHGVGFGGISVGGMVNNRKFFATQLPGVDHLPHTHDLARNAWSRGQRTRRAARRRARVISYHDASTIAAVIVEPVGLQWRAGPPRGYLNGCARSHAPRHPADLRRGHHGSRFGTPFAAQCFDVVPDMITMAKGMTNGAVPAGAVAVRSEIYEAFMTGPDSAIELFHGHTYPAHPVACAAGSAQQIYRREGLLTRAQEVGGYWADALHALKDRPHVIDLRNFGLIGAIELEPIAGKPGARGFDAFLRAFEKGILIRVTGDTIALSPPLIIERSHIDQLFGRLDEVLSELP
jgi:beta-alanine--pyruvate transaminase